MAYNRGDVVLVNFPFADRRGQKKRPAVVVSGEPYNSSGPDVILAALTSRIAAAPRPGDHVLAHWDSAGLAAPSMARARLNTVAASKVLRVLGSVSTDDMHGISSALAGVLHL